MSLELRAWSLELRAWSGELRAKSLELGAGSGWERVRDWVTASGQQQGKL